ncbi:Leucine rich repeat containing protein BspA family protein [Entamoeba marina]
MPLQRVFMMNVILYLDSFNTLKKVICVSKKCLTATTSLYTNPIHLPFSSQDMYELFNLIPHIQTLHCEALALVTPTNELKDVTLCITCQWPQDKRTVGVLHKYESQIKHLTYPKVVAVDCFAPLPNLSLMTALTSLTCCDDFLLHHHASEFNNTPLKQMTIKLDTLEPVYIDSYMTGYSTALFTIHLIIEELDEKNLQQLLQSSSNIKSKPLISCIGNNLTMKSLLKHVTLLPGPNGITTIDLRTLGNLTKLVWTSIKFNNPVDLLLPSTLKSLVLNQALSVVSIKNLKDIQLESLDITGSGRLDKLHLPSSLQHLHLNKIYELQKNNWFRTKSYFNKLRIPLTAQKLFVYNCNAITNVDTLKKYNFNVFIRE